MGFTKSSAKQSATVSAPPPAPPTPADVELSLVDPVAVVVVELEDVVDVLVALVAPPWDELVAPP